MTVQYYRTILLSNLVPRLHPAYHHLQYRKAGESLVYIFSHVSDVSIERMIECAWAHWAQNSKKSQATT